MKAAFFVSKNVRTNWYHKYLEVSAGHRDVLEQHGLPVVQVVLRVVLAPADAAEAVDLIGHIAIRGTRSEHALFAVF